MMRTCALIATVLLALALFGCSGGQPEEVMKMVADMESELDMLKNELVDVKAKVKDLKSELSTCKIEMQTLVQQKLQEAEDAAEGMLKDMPLPGDPTKQPVENPLGAAE
jgi:regulator of replication initiation timing